MALSEKERLLKAKDIKKNIIKSKIKRLADKVIVIMGEIQKFGPAKVRTKLTKPQNYRYESKFHKHWYKMAKISLICTRKKIYRLEAELKNL